MSLNNFQYDALMRAYNEKQLNHKHEQDEHIRQAYDKIPRLQEIDGEIASLSLKKARALLLPSPKDDFDLSAAIAELSEERTALLQIHGYPPDYLELKYDCPFCKDTGYVENQKCSCFKKAAVDLLYIQSNIREILETENFENFSFEYYPQDITNPATGLSALETAQDAVATQVWERPTSPTVLPRNSLTGRILCCIFHPLTSSTCWRRIPSRRMQPPLMWPGSSMTATCSSLTIWEPSLPIISWQASFSAASMNAS